MLPPVLTDAFYVICVGFWVYSALALELSQTDLLVWSVGMFILYFCVPTRKDR